MTERVKFAYLTYDDMLLRLESGEINEYDVIFSKDKLTTYIITADLKPIELKSRVYVFDSIEDAEKVLNESSDTYVGQIVSILYEDTYKGYIVNKKNGRYNVTPLCQDSKAIDSNTLEIEKLDADVTSAAVEEGNGIQVNVKEVDGKITEVVVSGNFDNKYDSLGTAATVEISAKGYADGLYSVMNRKVTALEDMVGDGFAPVTEDEINTLFLTED